VTGKDNALRQKLQIKYTKPLPEGV